jgi:peroxiredoxin
MRVSLLSLFPLFLWMGSGPDGNRAASHVVDRPAHLGNAVAGRVPEPPLMVLGVGDPAPNFAFEGYDGHVMRLHHLLDQGSVLLVFGAHESELRKLQQQRAGLLDLGVVPVAFVDARPNATRMLVKRLGLEYTVIADGRGVIAELFNVVDGERVLPAWFVLDARGRVRGLSRGTLPSTEYRRLCARALVIPMPGVAYPTSH